jgi:hypothetical protein
MLFFKMLQISLFGTTINIIGHVFIVQKKTVSKPGELSHHQILVIG